MTIEDYRHQLAHDLEAHPRLRRFGTGWISGVLALVLGLACLAQVVSLRYPSLFATPELAIVRDSSLYRPVLQAMLLAAYALAIASLFLRPRRVLGFTALGITIVAALLGGSQAQAVTARETTIFFGLDFFVLNILFTGFLFVPIERFFPHIREQRLFRAEWREDLFYFLVSSMMVQVLTFLSMAPSKAIVAHTNWEAFRAAVGSQPWLLQLVEIMILTDLAQYWLHRAFHRVPFLWGFHAVHHSAKAMDWLAGARMHFLEIIVLRGFTAVPMFTLGYDPSALQAYVLIVYVYSSYIHANVKSGWAGVDNILVTPRYHHWHHGIDRDAIDVNFAIHFPILDRLFGTFHLPKGAWPSGYGVEGHPVPSGYWRQFLYPFQLRRP